MRRDDQVDFFVIEDHQIAIHDRLENWARYVASKGIVWQQGPIWKLGKSNSRQWDVPELRPPVNQLDGADMEIAVRALPEKQRDALRWNYVYRGGALHAARRLGVTKEGLLMLVRSGRQMLINRRV